MIEAEGLRLYHSGDSLAYDGLAERLGPEPFDVLFLPINGRDPARGVPGNMSAAEAVDLATEVRPRFVVPHHYDMFTFNTVPVAAFEAEARRLPPGRRAPGLAVRRALGDHAVSVTLGIDIGTSGTKTLAIDERGDDPRLGVGRVSVRPPPARLVGAGPRALVGGDRRRPSATSWREASFKPADVAGHRPQRPDARLGLPRRRRPGDPPRPALERPADGRRVRRDRGAGRRPRGADPAWSANPALTGFTAPKLLWVRKHEPANWDRVRQVLLPKDYIRYRLTGTYATEVSDASGTLLLDVANRRWSRELLGKLDLDPALLPACYESPEVSAKVSEHRRRRRPGLAAGHAGRRRRRRPAGRRGGQRDRPAGRGLGDDGDLGRRLRPRRPSSASTRWAGSSAAATPCPGAWHVMGVVLAAGGSFQWFRNELGKAEVDAGQGSRGSTPTSCSPTRPRSPAPGPRGCSSCPT